jgi:hypothetical protein
LARLRELVESPGPEDALALEHEVEMRLSRIIGRRFMEQKDEAQHIFQHTNPKR